MRFPECWAGLEQHSCITPEGSRPPLATAGRRAELRDERGPDVQVLAALREVGDSLGMAVRPYSVTPGAAFPSFVASMAGTGAQLGAASCLAGGREQACGSPARRSSDKGF